MCTHLMCICQIIYLDTQCELGFHQNKTFTFFDLVTVCIIGLVRSISFFNRPLSSLKPDDITLISGIAALRIDCDTHFFLWVDINIIFDDEENSMNSKILHGALVVNTYRKICRQKY